MIIMRLKTPAEVFTRLEEGCSYPEIENVKHTVDDLSLSYFISFFFFEIGSCSSKGPDNLAPHLDRSDFNSDIAIIHLSNLQYTALFSQNFQNKKSASFRWEVQG